jgi:hypothetical protein
VTGKCKNIRDPPPLIIEGMECKDSQNIATAFNLYFDATTIKKLNNDSFICNCLIIVFTIWTASITVVIVAACMFFLKQINEIK